MMIFVRIKKRNPTLILRQRKRSPKLSIIQSLISQPLQHLYLILMITVALNIPVTCTKHPCM